MRVDLAYGQGYLPVEFPKGRTTVISPSHTPGLTNEREAVIRSLEKPIGAPPLRESIKRTDRVCISFIHDVENTNVIVTATVALATVATAISTQLVCSV